MEDYSRERRGLFEGLKVPFCLNALIIAFVAIWVFRLGNYLLFKAMETGVADWGIVGTLLAVLTSLIKGGNPFQGVLSPFSWQNLIYAIWFVLVWAFFAGAIGRIMAMRIARDETIEMKSALGFAFKRIGTHIFAILFIVIAMVFFYACCMLAGVIGRIPYIGDLILILVYILVFISILIVTMLSVGLIFGLNLISASIATDGVDTFDAISRAYSYVVSRPWQIICYTVLPFVFITVFAAFAQGIFLDRVLGAVGIGMGPKWEAPKKFIMEIEEWNFHEHLQKTWENQTPEIIAQKKTDLENAEAKLEAAEMTVEKELWKDSIKSLKIEIDGKPNALTIVLAIVVKIMYFIAFYLILAYIVAYWIGSQTVAYFLLRKDVDGDRLEEVYLDEGEEEDSYFTFEKPKEEEPAEEKKEEEDEVEEAEKEEKPKKKKSVRKKKTGGKKSTRKKKDD
ncbi:MAG: hypothetical protein ACYS8W_09565 [Planctomycetota bacterium]|jgi:hypothetical protein